MIPEIIITALLLGWILRGRIDRLADGRIRYAWMIFVPLGTYFAAQGANYANVFPPNSPMFGLVNMVGMTAVLVFTYANREIPGARLMFAGLAINAFAIVANGGLMPVWEPAARAAYGEARFQEILTEPHVRHVFTDSIVARLGFLGDIVAAKKPYCLMPSVYSVGDFVLSLGGLIAIVAIMRTPLPSERAAAGGT